MSTIQYEVNPAISLEDFVLLLKESTLGERRPVDDIDCIRGMLENSNLIISARDDGKLVGIARSMTDFHFACYLSDLAVDRAYQRQGIGLRLQQLTREQLGPRCTLILISAPAANEYYPILGYEPCPRCWILPGNHRFGDKNAR